MCGRGGYYRVLFKIVGDGRADAELKQQEPVQSRKELLGAERTGSLPKCVGMEVRILTTLLLHPEPSQVCGDGRVNGE